jgi:hypothetical protein
MPSLKRYNGLGCAAKVTFSFKVIAFLLKTNVPILFVVCLLLRKTLRYLKEHAAKLGIKQTCFFKFFF